MASQTPAAAAPAVTVVTASDVVIDNLCVRTPERELLRGVSATLPGHEVTALVGSTGSGKTTLLRALNRLHDSNPAISVSGQVQLGNVDIYRDVRNVREVRRRIGMVFQRPNPFPQSVIDNITIGLRSHGLARGGQARDAARGALVDVGLWDEVKDRLNSSPFNLSGGQQQLLCLARALAVQPDALLLDEPTSSLDPGTTQHIEELIRGLSERMTIVLVTHNLQQARRVAHRVLFLAAGELVESASATDFFERPTDPRSRAYVAGVLGSAT